MKLIVRNRCLFRWILSALIFVSGTILCSGKEGTHYRSRTWQTDEGLPHNSVQAILQAADGYLWLGTVDGLARFDGARFTLFDEKLPPEVRGLWVSSICEAHDGSLWAATDGKGLLQIRGNQYSRLSRADGLGLPTDSLRTLYESHDGALWIGSANAGLIRYKDKQFSQMTQKDGLSNNTIRSICEDGEGNLWVGTGEGLDCIRNGKVTASYNWTNGLPRNSIRTLLLDREGALWIGSNGGVTRMKDKRFTNYRVRDGLLDDMVSALYQDHEGNLWVGTYGGLNKIENGRVLSDMGEGEAFNTVVYSIFEDRENNLWIGGRAGLSRLNPRRFSLLNKQQGLTHNSTVSVLESKAGGLWIGTWGGALNLWKEGKMASFPASEVIPITLLLAMHEDHEGALWLGTDYDGGFYRFKEGVFRRWGKQDGMTDLALATIYEDRQTNIWIGARTGLSVLRNESLSHFTSADGLPAVPIKVITQDEENNVWIGTADGLCLYQDGKFHRFSRKDGLSADTILSFYNDREHNLWIGTKGGGLNRLKVNETPQASKVNFEHRTLNFSSYTMKQGLSYDDVFEIVEDDFGYLWMSCGKGIFRASKKSFDEFDRGRVPGVYSIAYGKSDGMPSIDCKGVAKPAGCKTQDGTLWFPTDKGLIAVDPALKSNERAPGVVIEELITEEKRSITSDEWRVSERESSPPMVTLPPGRGELQIHYTALSFQAPEKNRFKYKLEGSDREWMDVGTRRVAYYNHLSPGKYLFRVIACNNDGIWNESGASLSIILLPQFWQSWWFRPIILLLAGSAGFGIYRLRMARFREIEKLRLRIAADLHDEVGSSLWSISLLSRMLQKEVITPEQKKDVSEINRIALQTANSIRDIVWFINPEYDTLQDLLLRMKDVAATTLGGIEFSFQQPQENLSQKLQLNFRQNIFLMFKEILANIVKHSQATKVEIKMSVVDQRWQMCIVDNGCGFDPATPRNGNGLKNLRRRAEKLGAELELDSKPGQGTRIVVSASVEWN